jgi:hypothetical protein
VTYTHSEPNSDAPIHSFLRNKNKVYEKVRKLSVIAPNRRKWIRIKTTKNDTTHPQSSQKPKEVSTFFVPPLISIWSYQMRAA